jgi:ArsR family transcriptional regulator, arsenate/arsenite/antimonite-responsive transcriptional repressor
MGTGKEQLMETERISDYVRLLRIIGHPTRLLILAELMKGTKCVNDIRDLLEVPQPNASQHLAVLKENGLVASRKKGVSRCYHLIRPKFVEGLFALMAQEETGAMGSSPTPRGGERGKLEAVRRTSRVR